MTCRVRRSVECGVGSVDLECKVWSVKCTMCDGDGGCQVCSVMCAL